MKNLCFALVALLFVSTAVAQGLAPIKLNAPVKDRGTSLIKALENRRSTREMSPQKLSLQDLSDLLWAANGINRPDGRRTAATAKNVQDIDVYAIMEEGAYLYDAKANELRPVVQGDLRPLVADVQAFVKDAPVCLLVVSDIARFKSPDREMSITWGALDAGIVAQNVMLFCSGCGLVTVPRAYMKKDELHNALKLSQTQVPMLNTPVGYPKK